MGEPDSGLSYGPSIREHRDRLEMNQVEVAQALGITPGHLSHLENEKRLPSLDLLFMIGDLFGLSQEEHEILIGSVEKSRERHAGDRLAARHRRVRGALRTRGRVAGSGSGGEGGDEIDVNLELDRNPLLRAAFEDLRTAIADPGLRETVAKTLQAFARSAEQR